MDIGRSDRIFDSFLEISGRRFTGNTERLGLVGRLRGRAGRQARRTCCDEAYERWQADVEAGSIQSFLEWLLANADEIFALIARLIALFS